MKIEIKNYRPTNKGGALVAYFTLAVDGLCVKVGDAWHPEPLQLELSDCKYFSKGDQKWFKYADKEYKNKQGETAYAPTAKFTLPQEMVLEALKLQEGNGQVPTNSRQTNQLQAESPFDFGRPPF